MVNWWKLSIPPIMTGIGYAMIESMIVPALWYAFTHDPDTSWYLTLVHAHPWIGMWFYRLGVAIILSIPWAILGDLWQWVFAADLAVWSEDAAFWIFIGRVPHSWGYIRNMHIYTYPTYPVHGGLPLYYIPAAVILVISIIMIKREEAKRTGAISTLSEKVR
ncbi:hypothetical protein [Vulcanisaeta thermophila]|uniref:hypothetical protein n=1 Tax=Vulcanisaeta thermophila TaxID=867917 RepID=UPI000852E16A|nr:hypothetical protein [Vulcanisaeta thermophila]